LGDFREIATNFQIAQDGTKILSKKLIWFLKINISIVKHGLQIGCHRFRGETLWHPQLYWCLGFFWQLL